MDNLAFYHNLILSISSDLELPKAWISTFQFLTQKLPIDGITLHRFSQNLQSLEVQFLVANSNFYEIDTYIPLTDEEMKEVQELEDSKRLIRVPNVLEDSISAKHGEVIKEYLPDKNRAYLLCLLSTEKKIIGHLCLVGKSLNCFTKEHEEMMQLIQTPISLAQINMMQYRLVQELKNRLDIQRNDLAGEVKLLKESSIIGAKGGLRQVMEKVHQLAGRETQVLILGETGTGKELFADAIQKISPRSDKPYVKINCGAIPDSLVDSELFGYEKGAFTGAESNKIGRFEQANDGTLFLDEIGELPLRAQVRLLRVLQNKTIERVGGDRSIPVNVRIIAATNRSLDTMMQNREFREDLFYRLNVFQLSIPPLRNRVEDIPALAKHFIGNAAKRLKLSKEVKLSEGALGQLQAYSWPGNVRELENLVERALILTPTDSLELDRYLPRDPDWYIPTQQTGENYFKKLIREQVNEALSTKPYKRIQQPTIHNFDNQTVLRPLDEVITEHIESIVQYCGGKISGPGGAAEILKVNHNTLRKRMQKLNISFGHKKKKSQ